MFLTMKGGFVMSDDSHGVEHLGTNYGRLLAFIQKVGIKEMHYMEADGVRRDSRFPNAGWSSIRVADLAQLKFWTNVE